MTNAQAALLAATQYHANEPAPLDQIRDTAGTFKTWLDRRDAEDQARIRVG